MGSLGQVHGCCGLYFVEFVCPKLYTENSFKEKNRKLVSPNFKRPVLVLQLPAASMSMHIQVIWYRILS